MKTQRSITVDWDVWSDLQRLYPNQLSSKINDFLLNLRDFSNVGDDGLEISKLRKNLENFDSELSKTQVKREKTLQKIEFLAKKMEKEVENKQKIKEKAIKNLITCDICGIPKLEERIHTVKRGKICDSCYKTGDKNTIKKYL